MSMAPLAVAQDVTGVLLPLTLMGGLLLMTWPDAIEVHPVLRLVMVTA